jgi:hypothetical protein
MPCGTRAKRNSTITTTILTSGAIWQGNLNILTFKSVCELCCWTCPVNSNETDRVDVCHEYGTLASKNTAVRTLW